MWGALSLRSWSSHSTKCMAASLLIFEECWANSQIWVAVPARMQQMVRRGVAGERGKEDRERAIRICKLPSYTDSFPKQWTWSAAPRCMEQTWSCEPCTELKGFLQSNSHSSSNASTSLIKLSKLFPFILPVCKISIRTLTCQTGGAVIIFYLRAGRGKILLLMDTSEQFKVKGWWGKLIFKAMSRGSCMNGTCLWWLAGHGCAGGGETVPVGAWRW